jgi:protease PrsW
MNWFFFTAAIAPVVFMLHFVYVRDKYEREPLGRVLLVFFLSFLTVIPAAIFESWFDFSKGGWIGLAITVWLVVALAEETAKYWALRLIALPHPSFNEVYDGIMYGVAASLGFATVENLAYVYMSAQEGFGSGLFVALTRAVLSVPGHALWGVMMGYFVGRAKFADTVEEKRRFIRRGWLAAVFWHGLYDFFAFGAEQASGLVLLAMMTGLILVIVINWRIAFWMIHDAQERSTFKRPALLINPVGALSFHLKYCHRCGRPTAREQMFCQHCGYEFPPKRML